MTDLADILARAIARSQGMPTTELDSPQRRLQAALDRLFALHMGLAVEAMRAAADDTPDFPAVGATLNDNSRALGQAVGVLYGQQAQAEFLQLWAQHVDALMAFATATRRHDRAGQDAARASLDRFAASMARFLATATHGRLPAVQLTGALTEHDSDLTTQLTAYAAGNFAAAEQTATTGYDHMFMLSETLATAIGSTVAARLPRGGAQTGGGGTAPRP
jgi:hypothetical protein